MEPGCEGQPGHGGGPRVTTQGTEGLAAYLWRLPRNVSILDMKTYQDIDNPIDPDTTIKYPKDYVTVQTSDGDVFGRITHGDICPTCTHLTVESSTDRYSYNVNYLDERQFNDKGLLDVFNTYTSQGAFTFETNADMRKRVTESLKGKSDTFEKIAALQKIVIEEIQTIFEFWKRDLDIKQLTDKVMFDILSRLFIEILRSKA